MVKLPKKLEAFTLEDGEEIMIICPGYWGRGKTTAEAVKAMPFSLDKEAWTAFAVPPGTTYDGMSISRPAGTAPSRKLGSSKD